MSYIKVNPQKHHYSNRELPVYCRISLYFLLCHRYVDDDEYKEFHYKIIVNIEASVTSLDCNQEICPQTKGAVTCTIIKSPAR